eukprot:TRINITY_DN10584_c0_g1_i1.p1 TRINITY_DN10584_c0_g1~~TRINITY_DN10584_c0_g1_i1.p1  ORF type:complete len:1357 (-),score=328.49 TRINITY_DN10584_c0_g1_i1:29-4099(-)
MAACERQVDFTEATELAQIVVGVAFIVLAMWLIVVNTSKQALSHKATYEQRLSVCVTINCAAALLSGFFNILQLTEVDDFVLPRPTFFVLDLSRPIEWIVTSPILQLSLVLMGGSRIPPYRRLMMPLLSVAIPLCGLASMFSEAPTCFWWYAFGTILAVVLFYHNGIQIGENSDGSENIFRGSSDFRVLSLMVVCTWFPFPLWFLLSPEGVGAITDAVVIHMGWGVLSILAKFSFIIYMQQAKTSYFKRVRATRELYEVDSGLEEGEEPTGKLEDKAEVTLNFASLCGGVASSSSCPPSGSKCSDGNPSVKEEERFNAVVSETMASLSMRGHADRFKKLLLQAKITNLEAVSKLTENECLDMTLPWNLVSQVQKRWRQEKMDTADMQFDTPSGSCVTRKAVAKGKYDTSDLAETVNPYQIQGRELYSPGLAPHEVLAAEAIATNRLNMIEDRLAKLLYKMDEHKDHLVAQVSHRSSDMIVQEHVSKKLTAIEDKMVETSSSLSSQLATATTLAPQQPSLAEAVAAAVARIGEEVSKLTGKAIDEAAERALQARSESSQATELLVSHMQAQTRELHKHGEAFSAAQDAILAAQERTVASQLRPLHSQLAEQLAEHRLREEQKDKKMEEILQWLAASREKEEQRDKKTAEILQQMSVSIEKEDRREMKTDQILQQNSLSKEKEEHMEKKIEDILVRMVNSRQEKEELMEKKLDEFQVQLISFREQEGLKGKKTDEILQLVSASRDKEDLKGKQTDEILQLVSASRDEEDKRDKRTSEILQHLNMSRQKEDERHSKLEELAQHSIFAREKEDQRDKRTSEILQQLNTSRQKEDERHSKLEELAQHSVFAREKEDQRDTRTSEILQHLSTSRQKEDERHNKLEELAQHSVSAREKAQTAKVELQRDLDGRMKQVEEHVATALLRVEQRLQTTASESHNFIESRMRQAEEAHRATQAEFQNWLMKTGDEKSRSMQESFRAAHTDMENRFFKTGEENLRSMKDAYRASQTDMENRFLKNGEENLRSMKEAYRAAQADMENRFLKSGDENMRALKEAYRVAQMDMENNFLKTGEENLNSLKETYRAAQTDTENRLLKSLGELVRSVQDVPTRLAGNFEAVGTSLESQLRSHMQELHQEVEKAVGTVVKSCVDRMYNASEERLMDIRRVNQAAVELMRTVQDQLQPEVLCSRTEEALKTVVSAQVVRMQVELEAGATRIVTSAEARAVEGAKLRGELTKEASDELAGVIKAEFSLLQRDLRHASGTTLSKLTELTKHLHEGAETTTSLSVKLNELSKAVVQEAQNSSGLSGRVSEIALVLTQGMTRFDAAFAKLLKVNPSPPPSVSVGHGGTGCTVCSRGIVKG